MRRSPIPTATRCAPSGARGWSRASRGASPRRISTAATTRSAAAAAAATGACSWAAWRRWTSAAARSGCDSRRRSPPATSCTCTRRGVRQSPCASRRAATPSSRCASTSASPSRIGCSGWRPPTPTQLARDLVAGRSTLRPVLLRMCLVGEEGRPAALAIETEGTAGGETVTVTSARPLAAARTAALTADKARDALGALGGTPYSLGEFEFAVADGLFLGVGDLKDLRRRAVAALDERRLAARRRRRRVARPGGASPQGASRGFTSGFARTARRRPRAHAPSRRAAARRPGRRCALPRPADLGSAGDDRRGCRRPCAPLVFRCAPVSPRSSSTRTALG